MNKEIWKDIEGYNGLYKVSNLGNILNAKRDNKRRQHIGKYGYLIIGLFKDGKVRSKSVHRLVAAAFIPNPDNKPQVNHINEIKTDNRVENLNWMTNYENSNHGTRNKRISKALIGNRGLAVVRSDGVEYKSMTEASHDGFLLSKICLCCKGKRNTHGGFKWKYKEK